MEGWKAGRTSLRRDDLVGEGRVDSTEVLLVECYHLVYVCLRSGVQDQPVLGRAADDAQIS